MTRERPLTTSTNLSSHLVHTLCTLLMTAAVLSQGACANRSVVLARDGKAACTIVLPAEALELEQTAARELADHLEKIVGDRPRMSDEPGPGANIYVGRSPAIDRLVDDVDFDALGTDGIVMRTVGDDLVLTGGRPRGVLFCVYSFLQDVVGVRWWAPDTTHIPAKPSLVVPNLDVTYRPPFDLRQILTGALADSTFALRQRLNGGVVGIPYADHSILKLLPPEEHYLEHPDWYMYRRPGDKRNPEYSDDYSFDGLLSRMKQRPQAWYDLAVKTRRVPYQPCTSSAGAIEATTAAVLRQLEEEYPKWRYPPKFVLVTQSNGAAECECDACLATKRREGSSSASWLEFVNAIAERVEKQYPDVQIAMMAFLHLEKPPAHVRPRHNVLVYSIPVTSDRKLPLKDVAEGQWTARWCDIARHVYIWEHEANFWNPLQPHPNHFVVPENLRFFAEHGVKGVVIEGKSGNASELGRMRAYVESQLLWDPRRNARQLMTEFLGAYYGAAGPFLMQWIELQQRAVLAAKDYVHVAYALSTDDWLTVEDLNRGVRLFEQALAAVRGDETLEQHVRRARLSVDVVWLQSYEKLRAAAESGLPFLGPDDPLAALERIAENEFGLRWPQFPKYVEKLRASLKAD